jgi:ferredoxin
MVKIEVVDESGASVFSTDFATDRGNDTLLDLLLTAGYAWPHGCRSGTCASCMAEILEGAELLPPRTFVENDTLTRIGALPAARLACRIGPLPGSKGRLRLRPCYA